MRTRNLLVIPSLAVIAVGCERATSSPTEITPNLSAVSASASASFPRSGTLHVTKNCSTYFGNPGEFCTITSSNVEAIEVGSRVVYARALVDGTLDSDLILDLPGAGNNVAFGHVVLDLPGGHGRVTFSGGTGKFTHFAATIDVAPLTPDLINWNWDGAYSFQP